MRIGQPEPKRGNPRLLVTLIALSLLMVTVYFREGDSGPLHVARGVMIEVTAPIARLGTAITGPFRSAGDWIESLGVSRERLETLEAQNAELRKLSQAVEPPREGISRLSVPAFPHSPT